MSYSIKRCAECQRPCWFDGENLLNWEGQPHACEIRDYHCWSDDLGIDYSDGYVTCGISPKEAAEQFVRETNKSDDTDDVFAVSVQRGAHLEKFWVFTEVTVEYVARAIK